MMTLVPYSSPKQHQLWRSNLLSLNPSPRLPRNLW